MWRFDQINIWFLSSFDNLCMHVGFTVKPYAHVFLRRFISLLPELYYGISFANIQTSAQCTSTEPVKLMAYTLKLFHQVWH